MKTKPKPLTEEDLPAPGSVFLFPLEDGQYSIARVARRITRVNPTTSTPKRQKVNAMVPRPGSDRQPKPHRCRRSETHCI